MRVADRLLCLRHDTGGNKSYTYAEYGTTSPVSCVPSPPSDTPPAPKGPDTISSVAPRANAEKEKEIRAMAMTGFGSLAHSVETPTRSLSSTAPSRSKKGRGRRGLSRRTAHKIKRKSHPIEKVNGYQQSTEVEQKTKQRSVKSQSHTHNRPAEQQQGGDTEKSTETSMNTNVSVCRERKRAFTTNHHKQTVVISLDIYETDQRRRSNKIIEPTHLSLPLKLSWSNRPIHADARMPHRQAPK